MKIPFTKMHGAGNDFVFLESLDGSLDLTEDQIKKICHRRFGIGCDQLLIVAPSRDADFRMDIFNADGGKVEMCGNGIRCFAKYVFDQGLTKKTSLEIETMAGLIKPEILITHPQNSPNTLWVKVDMGEPILEAEDIPVNAKGLVINHKLELLGAGKTRFTDELRITCVSMGNPHCVLYVNSTDLAPVDTLGPEIENHPFFPNRVNVEFVQILDPKNIRMRVWERGAGETMACGTGACGATVASILNKKTERKIMVHLNGGKLEIEWNEDDDHVFMTGPATTVFEGTTEI